MNREWRILLVGLALLWLALPAQAQTDGRLMGTVMTLDAQPIPDATLVLNDSESGKKIQFKTDKKGKYYRRGIPPAVYELRVTKAGYQEFKGDNIKVPAGGEKTIDITLAPLVEVAPEPVEDTSYREGYEALKSGDLETAKTKMEAVLAETPDDFRATYILGHVQLRQGDMEAAQRYLEQALQLKPDAGEVYFDLGTVAAKKKDWAKAQQNFQRAAELEPGDAEAHYSLGVSYLNEEKPAEAAAALQRAVELKPDHANAHKSLGYALLQEGNLQGTLAHLERYLELLPKDEESTTTVEVDGKAETHRVKVEKGDRAEVEEILAEVRKSLAQSPQAP